ncbi:head-tail joining protein [Aliiruegeria sabulilitoris]|uniref:head-tail joining protein n=1 Tax=Aliiruegeria sabulilitoris TaxID=1510458 RepID=UPI00083056D7|nr:hypothetical protein [Aliiruegeria sabulilitoris]
MSIFAAAIDALFADPHMAQDALWRAGGGGGGVAIRVMRRATDDTASFNGGRFVVDTVLFDLRVSEAPELAAGDTLEVAGEVFEIAGEPVRDRERFVWQAEARAA